MNFGKIWQGRDFANSLFHLVGGGGIGILAGTYLSNRIELGIFLIVVSLLGHLWVFNTTLKRG